MSNSNPNSDYQVGLDYHERTRHSEHSIRNNPHFLDWKNQPLPFKIYEEVEAVPLSRDPGILTCSPHNMFDAGSSQARGRLEETIPDIAMLSNVLYLTAGITKRKTMPGGEMHDTSSLANGDEVANWRHHEYAAQAAVEDASLPSFPLQSDEEPPQKSLASIICRRGSTRAFDRERSITFANLSLALDWAARDIPFDFLQPPGGRMYLAAYGQGFGASGCTFFDDEVTEFFSPHAADKSVMFLTLLGYADRTRIAGV